MLRAGNKYTVQDMLFNTEVTKTTVYLREGLPEAKRLTSTRSGNYFRLYIIIYLKALYSYSKPEIALVSHL